MNREEDAPLLNEEHIDSEISNEDDDRDEDIPSPERRYAGYGPAGAMGRQGTWAFVREMLLETVPTLALSTVGLTFTGELVEVVANWKAMKRIDELFILIPVLNNMKGNLEMNLSSRLSTAAYIGALDTRSSRRSILIGNLLLLQVQAIAVSALAGAFSVALAVVTPSPPAPSSSPASIATRALGILAKRKAGGSKPVPDHEELPGWNEFVFVIATSMSSASLSALCLGSFMCTLVVLCRRYGVDPDNVAPPIASALGDLLTLSLLSLISTLLLPSLSSRVPTTLLISISLLSICAYLAYRVHTHPREDIRKLLPMGWPPLVFAMGVTSASGLVLDQFVGRYNGFGLLAIVISGLPGGVGSVFVYRISTSLHAASISSAKEISPSSSPSPSPPPTASTKHENRRMWITAYTLFGTTLPVQIVFLLFLHLSGWVQMDWIFVGVFIVGFCVAVIVSLTLAYHLTHFLWRRGYEPDMYALPVQSSLIDLVGQCVLVSVFEIVGLLKGSK